MSFTLYSPTKATATTTVELPSAQRGNTLKRLRGQALARTASGARVVYDRGTDRFEASFAFEEITSAQQAALQSFFDNQADGLSESFEVEDHLGALYAAWFTEPELDWTNTHELTPGGTDGRYSLSIVLELEALT